jgi:diguanylate cyclase (GGDEF)-like protein
MNHTKATHPEVATLHALLTMARDLLQLEDEPGVLTLAGKAISELAKASGAYLLVRTDAGEIASRFDHAGQPHAADSHDPWHALALRRLQGEDGRRFMQAARTLIVSAPADHPMAVLVAGWDDHAGPDLWVERRRTLDTILDLVAAALGRLATRSSLEGMLTNQVERMAQEEQAHAAELARRDRSVRVLSLTDILTGMNNRRGFLLQAEHVFKLAQRQRSSSAVIYADVDDLKLINDQQGHEAGDQLIRDVATVFRESFRETDVLARLGGDEFAAYTLDDDSPGVITTRLQQNLHAFNLMQERPYHLSISVGVVECDPDGDLSLLNYIGQADQEMSRHKRARLH